MANRILSYLSLNFAILIASCDSGEKSPPGSMQSGVRGTVLGQRMPGENRDKPPRPQEPLAGVIVRVVNESGAVVATTKTDGDGRFQVNLLAGKYVVKARNPTDPHKDESRNIEVQAGRFSEVVLVCPLYD